MDTPEPHGCKGHIQHTLDGWWVPCEAGKPPTNCLGLTCLALVGVSNEIITNNSQSNTKNGRED